MYVTHKHNLTKARSIMYTISIHFILPFITYDRYALPYPTIQSPHTLSLAGVGLARHLPGWLVAPPSGRHTHAIVHLGCPDASGDGRESAMPGNSHVYIQEQRQVAGAINKATDDKEQ